MKSLSAIVKAFLDCFRRSEGSREQRNAGALSRRLGPRRRSHATRQADRAVARRSRLEHSREFGNAPARNAAARRASASGPERGHRDDPGCTWKARLRRL